MAAIYMEPLSGTEGSITLNGIIYPMSQWKMDWKANPVMVNSKAGSPWEEVMPGLRSAVVTCNGFVRREFNPFVGSQKVKIGTYVNVLLSVDADFSQIASCQQAYVANWVYEDKCTEVATFGAVILGNWTFKDFSATIA